MVIGLAVTSIGKSDTKKSTVTVEVGTPVTVEAQINSWKVYSMPVEGGKIYFSYNGGMAFVPGK
jgi:hypothetical protein